MKTAAPLKRAIALLDSIPHGLIALLGRFSVAAVFWKSGQTKVEGLAIDIVSGEFTLGIPHHGRARRYGRRVIDPGLREMR